MFAQNPKTQPPEDDGGSESGGASGEQSGQRLHLVKGIRENVEAVTEASAAPDTRGETERVLEEKIAAETFVRSAALRMIIDDFFRKTPGIKDFLDINKVDIRKEVLQILGYGEKPQKNFLRDRCNKYDKNYSKLEEKIQQTFGHFKKLPGHQPAIAAREEARSRPEVLEKIRQFIEAGAFASALFKLAKNTLEADIVRQAAAEYEKLCSGIIQPNEETTPVLYAQVQKFYKIFNPVILMTHLKHWIIQLNKARDAFGKPAEATTPELAPLKGERRLEVVEQFLMSDSVNEILRQFLRKAVDNADVLFSAKTALGQFLLTGFRDIDHIRRIQHRGINFEALARAVFSSFQKYRRSAEGSEGASEDRDVG